MNITPELSAAIQDILQISQLPPRWDDEQGFQLKQRLAVADPELLEQLELALHEGESGEVLESEGRVARTRSGVNDGFKSLYCDRDAFSGEWNPSRAKIGGWVGALIMVPLIGLTVFGTLSAQSAAPPADKPVEAVTVPVAEAGPSSSVNAGAPNTATPQRRTPETLGGAPSDEASAAAPISVAPSEPGNAGPDGLPASSALPSSQPLTGVPNAPGALRVRQAPTVWGSSSRPATISASPAGLPSKPRPGASAGAGATRGAGQNAGAGSGGLAAGSAGAPNVAFAGATNAGTGSEAPGVQFAGSAVSAPSSSDFTGGSVSAPSGNGGMPAGASSSGSASGGSASGGSGLGESVAAGALAEPGESSSGSSQIFQRQPPALSSPQNAPALSVPSGPVSSSVFSAAPPPAAAVAPSSQGSAVFGSSKPVVVAPGKPVSSSVLAPVNQPTTGGGTPNSGLSSPAGQSGKPVAGNAAPAPLVQQSRYNPGDVVSANVAIAVDVPANSLVPIVWRDADSSEWYGTAKLVGSRVVIDLKSVLFGGVAYAVRARVVGADGSAGLPVSVVQRSPEQAEQAVESGFSALRDTLGQTVGDPSAALPANLGGLAWAFAESAFGFLGGGNRVTIPTGVVKVGLVGNIVVL